MNLLIPVTSKEHQEAQICSLDAKKVWAFVQIDCGSVKNISFYDTKEEIRELCDYLIVKNKDEFISDFIEEGFCVLVAPMQQSVDDIIEAFMFRELHEIGE